MKWFAKAMTFQILSRVPGGTRVHHALQELTGSTEQTDGRMEVKVRQTLRYWRWLENNTPPGWLPNASHLDLGTGWLPSVPVTMFALGAKRQYLVDVRRHLQPRAVTQTITQLRAVAPRVGVKFPRMPKVPWDDLAVEAMLEPLGMTYAAPYHELAQRIAGTVGYVTATYMLLHLDRSTLLSVLKTVHRLLAPGGYFLGLTHLRQLFDGLDSRSSPFFALRYPDWFWETIINSRMMSYNRLKAPDYTQALQEAGFKVVLMEVEPGDPEDFARLAQARVHAQFSRYTLDDLAARHLFIVARKPY